MYLRVMKVGCFGGGTGLSSVLGGLKRNPWLDLNAVVTMFDSGGSSGQLRDELGVLPPGDVLKCALALARNEREARRVLLSRVPVFEDSRLGGHTGGNLLLSMMEQYSGSFLAGVEGLRALLGCRGRVWPVSIEQASLCARYTDGSDARGEVSVDARLGSGHAIERIWLEPPVRIHPEVAAAIAGLEAVIVGPGSFFTSLMPVFAVEGVAAAVAQVRGPLILIANLLTEGRGMDGFTAADAVRRIGEAAGRPVTAVVFNESRPSAEVLARYHAEDKRPLELGTLPDSCMLVSGRFWKSDIARHDRSRLAHALWAVLAANLERRSRPRA
ncbi:MAG TPA: YvcK family protein [Vicinamibacterales bacterium]|nr:YvcK family protein [Vicinamibacterales bacterium]HOG28304.1 YvcK family protein [Vicinamibacterales bacterium]HOQ59898.1 YvcK family protein [Vicinamibacterales bacterium]HPK71490.1 YvcK family protein [Vicinamibacterales bacterium]HPW21508.1 YvcK family protein [Vicinamibacterales bacterium]